MAGSIERIVSTAYKTNISDPFSRISAAVSRETFSNKGGVLVAETLKEGALLPLRNIAQISQWTAKSVLGVMGGILKTGLMAATLIPVPLPGGFKNIAEVRGALSAASDTIRLKAEGRPESFKEIFARIRGVRNDAEAHATGAPV